MEMNLKLFIEKIIGQTIIGVKNISEGHSTECKYALVTLSGKYFIRVLPYSDDIAKKYDLLMDVGKKLDEISAPIFAVQYGNLLVAVFAWFEGSTLEQRYLGRDNADQLPLAIKVGKAIRRFHDLTRATDGDSLEFFSPYAVESFTKKFFSDNRRNAFEELLSKVSSFNLEYSLIHYDLRPANIMVGHDDRLAIIDFEYMSFQPSYADLTCCFLFSERYRSYGYGLIYGYFNGCPPENFWQGQKSLLAFELLRFAANKRNSDHDIKRKLDYIADYLFSDELMPLFFEEWNKSCQGLSL